MFLVCHIMTIFTSLGIMADVRECSGKLLQAAFVLNHIVLCVLFNTSIKEGLLFSCLLFLFVGLFERNRCPRGKNCNFLHVYKNPGNEFNHREELSPGHTPYNGRRSERSDGDWRRDPRSRYRELTRDRSQDRDWTVKEHRKRRKRDWSRERHDRFYRHQRRSEERDHSRGRHEEQDKRRRKDGSSDEGDVGENEDKHLSER